MDDSKTYHLLAPRIKLCMRSMPVKRYGNPERHYEADSLDEIFNSMVSASA
ncbi:MAG: hypothetical protein FGF53_00895 [Candidatus Brockarchaeota archaeon]|nr:hypothetical protein [Candidatus Brockarchaeota archaeon]MBO3808479.1 hypothetical protein [Candidatus Brockarchaeota archaeon]